MSVITRIAGDKTYAEDIVGLDSGVKRTALTGWSKVGGVKKQIFGPVPNTLIIFDTGSIVDTTGLEVCGSGAGSYPDLTSTPQLLRAAAADGGALAGVADHSHGLTSMPTLGGSNGVGSPGLFSRSKIPRTHTHSVTHQHGSLSIEPSRRTVTPYGVLTSPKVPVGATLFYTGASAPPGWTRQSAYDDRYLLMHGTPGTNGGANSHTHSHSATSGSYSASTLSGNAYVSTRGTHAHSESHTHDSKDHQPPYETMLLISADAATRNIPPGVVAFFRGSTVPDGWSLYSGDFFRCGAAPGLTGGASTHSHASEPFSTGNPVNGSCDNYGGTSGTSYAGCNHSHSFNHGHNSQPNLYFHRELLCCIKD